MMVYTAVIVPMTDFLTGVLLALVIYFVVMKFLTGRKKRVKATPEPSMKYE